MHSCFELFINNIFLLKKKKKKNPKKHGELACIGGGPHALIKG
jgi:hypothetical protein